MNGHELAARFIAEVRWGDLPADVRRIARLSMADNLGATLAGTPARVSRVGSEYVAAAWPGDAATVLLHGVRSSAAGAAFANGCAANAIDIDDSTRYAYGHGGAQIFPTALAVAEARGLSGAEMLCGMVAGYEVAHRIGRCWHASRAEYQACGSWGSVACAAAAAHLMRLPADQAWHALGIAEYHAPNLPMMRDIAHPAMVKHGIHWGALTGVTAAELAAHGFTGIPSLLAADEYQDWVCDIGQNYLMVDGVAWKPKGFACCGWAHAAVEGARRLVDEYHVAVDDIAGIHIDTFHESAQLGVRLPSTTEEAQFNLAWPVAAMLVDGEIGPRQIMEPRLADPVLRGVAGKVTVTESAELNELCRLFEQGDPRGRFASEVTVALNNGAKLKSGLVGGSLSFPQPGRDERMVEEKFRWLASFVLEPPLVDRLMELLWHFDEIPNVRRARRGFWLEGHRGGVPLRCQ